VSLPLLSRVATAHRGYYKTLSSLQTNSSDNLAGDGPAPTRKKSKMPRFPGGPNSVFKIVPHRPFFSPKMPPKQHRAKMADQSRPFGGGGVRGGRLLLFFLVFLQTYWQGTKEPMTTSKPERKMKSFEIIERPMFFFKIINLKN